MTTDLVYRNGRIHTLDPAHPEAQALGVRAGRLVAVGSESDVARAVARDAHVVDLEGRTGKLADFVVLDRDPLVVSPEEIKSIQVEQTVVGGEVIHAQG